MGWIGFDIETSGDLPEYALQPWRVKDRQAWIRTWVEARADGNYPFVTTDFEGTKQALTEMIRRWVENKDTICAWNATFEISWLAAYVDLSLLRRVRWLDGMLLWRHLENAPEYETAADKRRSFGLKKAVAEFLPKYAGYDDGVDFHGNDIMTLVHYNACDSWFTRAITKHLHDTLAQEPQRLRAALIESHCLFDMGYANYMGVEIAPEGLQTLGLVLQGQMYEQKRLLSKHGATDKILASPKQLQTLLFEGWGLTPIKYGKTGPSTDKETLHELSVHDKRVSAIRAYREAKNNLTKFVDNIGQAIEYNNDGRAHPQARVFGTYSGRLTYSSSQGTGKAKRQTGWAIHQMKRSSEFRGLVKAPDGYSIVEFDAAGQEFRWMAILSGDETMLNLCLPGGDAHAYMGASIAGVGYDAVKDGAKAKDKEMGAIRQLGKVANLSLQYRTSAKKLLSVARTQYGMDMTLPTAERIHRTYQMTYRGVPRYWQQQINKIMRYHYAETLAGRRVKVSRRMIVSSEWSVQSTSINYPVQGTGADQKYLALSVLRPLLEMADAKFLFDLHDGLYFLVPNATRDQFISDVRYALDNLPYEKAWGFKPTIPLPFDVKVGTTWGNMEEL